MQTSDQSDRQGGMKTPAVVSPEAWEAARQQMLVKEKALMRARDALAAERRRMPHPRSRAAGRPPAYGRRRWTAPACPRTRSTRGRA